MLAPLTSPADQMPVPLDELELDGSIALESATMSEPPSPLAPALNSKNLGNNS